MISSCVRKVMAVAIFHLALNFSQSEADEPEVVDLIIVAGQSNAVGFDADASKLPKSPIDQDVMFWWRCGDPPPDRHDASSGSAWKTLGPQPVGEPKPKDPAGRQYGNFAGPEGFGPEIGLARHLKSAQPHQKLAIIKVAFSGTGLRRDWSPTDETGKSGQCYRALVAETRSAIEAAGTGIVLRPRAVIWVQGESDANATDAPHYKKALTELIAAIRRDLKAPDLSFLAGVNTKFGNGENAYLPRIVEAQRAAAAEDTNCIYVDTAAATTANKFHYDTQGTLDVGSWFAEALIKLEER